MPRKKKPRSQLRSATMTSLEKWNLQEFPSPRTYEPVEGGEETADQALAKVYDLSEKRSAQNKKKSVSHPHKKVS